MLTDTSSNICSVKCPEEKSLTLLRPRTDRMNFLSEAESVLNSVYTHWSSQHALMSQHDETLLRLSPERRDAQRGGSGTNPNSWFHETKPATRTADELHRQHRGIWFWSGPREAAGERVWFRLRVKTHKERSQTSSSSKSIYCCELLIYSKTDTVYVLKYTSEE